MAKPDFEREVIENEINEIPANLKVVNSVTNSLNNKSSSIVKPGILENNKLEIESSEKKPMSDGSLRSETITILPAPLSQRILSRLERQKNKYWHFKFVEDSDFAKLESKLLEAGLTVQSNYGGKKHADITLFKDDNIVGKIHFLHANRPDICDPTTFYVKLHFYDFEDDLFESVKTLMKSFFRSLDSSNNQNVSNNRNFRGGKKTRRRKRVVRRKTRRS